MKNAKKEVYKTEQFKIDPNFISTCFLKPRRSVRVSRNYQSDTSVKNHDITLTISSILSIIATVSVANLTALVDTNNGCTTFSSNILVICPFLTLIPAFVYNSVNLQHPYVI